LERWNAIHYVIEEIDCLSDRSTGLELSRAWRLVDPSCIRKLIEICDRFRCLKVEANIVQYVAPKNAAESNQNYNTSIIFLELLDIYCE
jgi:hypothetical protein